MAANDGRDLVLKLGAVAASPVTIAAARTNSFAIANEVVDITNKDSNAFRTLLEGAGTKALTLEIEGVLDKSSSADEFLLNANNNSIDTYSLFFNNGNTLEGQFQVESFSISGDHNTEQTFTATLQSSGAYTLVQA